MDSCSYFWLKIALNAGLGGFKCRLLQLGEYINCPALFFIFIPSFNSWTKVVCQGSSTVSYLRRLKTMVWECLTVIVNPSRGNIRIVLAILTPWRYSRVIPAHEFWLMGVDQIYIHGRG